MLHSRVLVVGTTSDYIDIIYSRHRDRAFFVTDTAERNRATEQAPPTESELVCDLSSIGETLSSLRNRLSQSQIRPSGVTCFDCESMPLAALIAFDFELSYPSPETINMVRNKYLTKSTWTAKGVPCPDCTIVRTESEAIDFFRLKSKPIVLKPLTGSGSEFVSLCRNEHECSESIRSMAAGLASHPNIRMYPVQPDRLGGGIPRKEFLAEEFIGGREYSCDFVIDGNRIKVIRIAQKIRFVDKPFGTTTGYLLPSPLPPTISLEAFEETIHAAARALNIDRAICMLDFMVSSGGLSLIELTPRPGGDCLPPLILHSSELDVLGFALDFAEGGNPPIPPLRSWNQLVGLRIIATRSGVIQRLDMERAARDPRVLECDIRHEVGDRVCIAGASYDSRILGHIIFRPSDKSDIEQQCEEIESLLDLNLEYDL
jgi:biotin carboxylase